MPDLAGAGKQEPFPIAGSDLEHGSGPLENALDGLDGALHDELDPDGAGQVKDLVALARQHFQHLEMHHRIFNEAEARLLFQAHDVLVAPGAQIIQDGDLLAGRDQTLGQMRPNETGPAGDKTAHHHHQQDGEGDEKVNDAGERGWD